MDDRSPDELEIVVLGEMRFRRFAAHADRLMRGPTDIAIVDLHEIPMLVHRCEVGRRVAPAPLQQQESVSHPLCHRHEIEPDDGGFVDVTEPAGVKIAELVVHRVGEPRGVLLAVCELRKIQSWS